MKVLIAGGGIGGLATALSLHEAGIEAEVFEKAREVHELGVGINMLPHAVKELAALGLLPALHRVGIRTRELIYMNRLGQTVWQEPRGIKAGYDTPQVSIHRGKLLGVLYEAALERLGRAGIHTDHRLVGFEQRNDQVVARFARRDGGAHIEAVGDALIGADGIHSWSRSFGPSIGAASRQHPGTAPASVERRHRMRLPFRQLLAAAMFALIAGSTEAASFDCTRASTKIEHLICNNHALSARDDIMAGLYAAALKYGDKEEIRSEQRRWLSTLQACRDAACAKERYDSKIGTLLRTKGAQKVSTNFYTNGSNGNDGHLAIFGPQHGLLAVSITSTYVGPGEVAAGDVYADGVDGVIALMNGRGELASRDCIVALHRVDDRTWRVTQAGRCPLASGVTFAGVYRR